MKTPDLEIVSDAAALARRGAELFVEEANRAIRERGRFTIALSGGSTPKRLYELLAGRSTQLPWEQTHFFWTDERHVPPDHPDSNFKLAHTTLLSKVPVPSTNIHRIKSELPDPIAAALDYEQVLTDFFEGAPILDFTLLGMGADAHTASIFPGLPELLNCEALVASAWIEKLKTNRTTLTMRVINTSRSVVFLVSGEEKATALSNVLEGPQDPITFPAQAVNPNNGRLKWLVDEAAASKLKRRSY